MYDFIDQKRIVYITFAVILFISALFAPVAFFYPIKTMFITPDALAIGTSSMSLLTGGIGLALMAGGLIVLAMLEPRLKKYGFAFALFVSGIIALSFSLTDYYYITSDGFVYNAPLSITSEKYEWTDFEKVEERIVKENGMTKIDSFSFHLKNGTVIDMPAGAILTMSGSIINNVQASGGVHERITEE